MIIAVAQKKEEAVQDIKERLCSSIACGGVKQRSIHCRTSSI